MQEKITLKSLNEKLQKLESEYSITRTKVKGMDLLIEQLQEEIKSLNIRFGILSGVLLATIALLFIEIVR